MTSQELNKLKEIIRKSILTEDGNPAKYSLLTSTDNVDQSETYRKITFGERDKNKPHKTILLVGETGTGKTTLINTIVNFNLGIKREDKVWFNITDDQSDRTSTKSQTSIITVYGVYLQESQSDLTIIDTPGYGDTRGIMLDKNVAVSLLTLSKSVEEDYEIHTVCLVIKAQQNRLSDRQIYIFDAVQSLFGKDVVKNIVLLLTHSNGAPPKNALMAVRDAKVKCAVDAKNQPVYFLFDNCLSDAADEEYEMIQELAWNLSFKGVERLFKFLDQAQPISLRMTQDVLQKRKQLEANISNLKSRVQDAELKQNELKQTQNALEENFKSSGNFEYEVDVPYREKVDIDLKLAYEAMCCSVCEENCHYPGCWWVASLSWCEVMKDNYCTVCTNKCHYSRHIKEAKIYVTKTKKEKRTYEDLKKKYNKEVMNKESLVKKLEGELHEIQIQKVKLLMDAFYCVDALQLIALNTDSLNTLMHIDFLIEKLKEVNDPEKAETLAKIKKRAGKERQEALEYLTKSLNIK